MARKPIFILDGPWHEYELLAFDLDVTPEARARLKREAELTDALCEVGLLLERDPSCNEYRRPSDGYRLCERAPSNGAQFMVTLGEGYSMTLEDIDAEAARQLRR